MDKDLMEFLLGLGVLILLFILIALFIKYLQRKLSRWSELATVFPAPETIPGIHFFKKIPGQAGRFSFSARNSGGISVGFTREGIIVRLRSRNYKDLLVPWNKIQSSAKYSMGLQTAAKIVVDSEIPLSFYLAEEALYRFETWHKVEQKPLEDFLKQKSNQ